MSVFLFAFGCAAGWPAARLIAPLHANSFCFVFAQARRHGSQASGKSVCVCVCVCALSPALWPGWWRGVGSSPGQGELKSHHWVAPPQ